LYLFIYVCVILLFIPLRVPNMRIVRSRNKQAYPHFYLRDKNIASKPGRDNKSTTPILFYYTYNKKHRLRLKYSTGLFIQPKLWDESKERVKASVLVDHDEMNQRLDLISQSAKAIAKDNPNINIVRFRNELDDIIGKSYVEVEDKETYDFFSWTKKFICEQSKRLDISPLTIKKYWAEYNKFKQFNEEERKDRLLFFDDIDLKLIGEYRTYLYSPPRNSSQNTVNKTLEVLAKFLKSATKETFINNNGEKVPVSTNKIYEDDEYRIKRVKTSKTILTFDQLLQLYHFDFSENKTLSHVRYLFLIMAFSGLRISDLMSLSKNSIIENADGTLMLHVFLKKGKEKKEDTEVYIPVIPELKEIFEIYNYNIPNKISQQKINMYVKEVCKLAGFNEMVEMKISTGGTTKTEFKPLYETISNHIARYSFITIAINEWGIKAEDLMKITGQTLKVLLGYEKGNKKKNAEKVGQIITQKRNQG
jgi:integrase